MVRLAAGLLGQAGDREPEQVGGAGDVEVDVGGADLQVGGGGAPVEPQREVVRREDLAEGHGREVVRVGDDVGVVDAEAAQLAAHVPAEGVVADPGDDRGAPAEPARGHGHVRGGAPEELAEGLDVLEPDAGLQRVDVHPAAPERQDLRRGAGGAHGLSSSVLLEGLRRCAVAMTRTLGSDRRDRQDFVQT